MVNVLDSPYENGQAQTLVNFLRPLTLISQKMVIDDAFLTLRSKRQNIAIVVDDNGKNVGTVTIEDLIEEIAGKR